MFDLEIPKRPEFKHVKKKKKLIEEIVEQVPYVISCEYPYITPKTEKLKRGFGLSIEADEKVYMCYISWTPKILSKVFRSAYRQEAKIGIGTLAPGEFKKAHGVDVVIYRLGGVNEEFLKVMREYL